MKQYYKYQNENFYVCSDISNSNDILVTYVGLEVLFGWNSEYSISVGHYYIPYQLPDRLYQVDNWGDRSLKDTVTFVVFNARGNVISNDILLGWYRDWDIERRAFKQKRRRKMNRTHHKSRGFRSPSCANELRRAGDPEHIPFIRGKRNFLSLSVVPYDHYHYSRIENNWKTNSKRRHQYKYK